MKINRPGAPRPAQKTQKAQRAAATEKTKPPSPADEISVLGIPDGEMTPRVRTALISLMEDVRDLRMELKEARTRIDELEKLADRDPMLDILNRRAFVRELDRALSMIDRYAMQASLVFIDLNDLKKINDNRGHAAGDAALAHVAKVLTENVRQTDVVARLGGDEFAILLLQADEAIAAAKAGDIAELVSSSPVRGAGEPFQASVSWGAVEIRQGASAQEAMNLADEAMYEAKKLK